MVVVYDLVIIGGGPAALAAAVYAARQKISFIVIAENVGGQTAISADIENYLGFPSTNGPELSSSFEKHINKYGVEVKEGEKALGIQKSGKNFTVKTAAAKYETKAVLIASGKKPRKLNVPGEDKLSGKGVTYCATCDAPVFAGKGVAIIGGGNSAMDAALLAEKYSNKVYIININPELKGDAIMMGSIRKSRKVTVFNSSLTTEIVGEKTVAGVKFRQSSGSEKTISVQGVFIEIGYIPSVDFDRLTQKNKWNEIIIHDDTEHFVSNLTSVPGIFAAGDVTDVPEKQIIVAAGEGVKAVLSIFKYLGSQVQGY
ncbi:FAD-dependent oxidoreductase [Candidatus Woesearchaeota archaeon]|nr:FAD-dependent oxidoreductase [Candidatus Woesearchaeota archaeon]